MFSNVLRFDGKHLGKRTARSAKALRRRFRCHRLVRLRPWQNWAMSKSTILPHRLGDRKNMFPKRAKLHRRFLVKIAFGKAVPDPTLALLHAPSPPAVPSSSSKSAPAAAVSGKESVPTIEQLRWQVH